MKRIGLPLVILLTALNTIAQQKSEYSVKGQINTNIYYQTRLGVNPKTYYDIEATYGLFKYFDAGIYYSNNFEKVRSVYAIGINARYYFTQFIIKNPEKINLFLKGILGKQWITIHHEYQEGIDDDSKGTAKDFGFLLGLRYMPLKKLGILTEFGYQAQTGVAFNIGVSFRIK